MVLKAFARIVKRDTLGLDDCASIVDDGTGKTGRLGVLRDSSNYVCEPLRVEGEVIVADY